MFTLGEHSFCIKAFIDNEKQMIIQGFSNVQSDILDIAQNV